MLMAEHGCLAQLRAASLRATTSLSPTTSPLAFLPPASLCDVMAK